MNEKDLILIAMYLHDAINELIASDDKTQENLRLILRQLHAWIEGKH